MLASSAVIVCVASLRTLAISSIVRTMKSSGSPGWNLVARAQQRGDAVGDLGRFARRCRRHGHLLNERDAAQLLHHRRVRHEDGVVLILAHPRLALARHHADDGEGLVRDADDLADRIAVGLEQLIADDAAEHGHLRGGRDVLRREERALVDRPRSDERQVDVGALHLRVPVLVAGHDLTAYWTPRQACTPGSRQIAAASSGVSVPGQGQ